jgi:adenine phosphoribosyltransferase
MKLDDAASRLAAQIRDVPDFPRKGIVFKDITPLLQNGPSLKLACELLAAPFAKSRVDLVVGIESRGFIFAVPVALALGAGFTVARKQGKLPWETRRESYELEYGSAEIEMHSDAVCAGQRVLIVDDVIATGGTAAATARLVRALGGEVVAASFLIELAFLDGRKALDGTPVEALLRY